jgi:hypothetical protein
MLDTGTLLVRGGQLRRKSVASALEDALVGAGRPGLCVFAAEWPDSPPDVLVPHNSICLTTPELVTEAGFDIEHTQEFGDSRHYTIWTPSEWAGVSDIASLVPRFLAIFRGPFQKGGVSDDLDTSYLRGLQPPGS